MRIADIVSPSYMIGCTVGVLVGYAWHRWSFSAATLADTVVLAVATEAFILIGSILVIGKWK